MKKLSRFLGFGGFLFIGLVLHTRAQIIPWLSCDVPTNQRYVLQFVNGSELNEITQLAQNSQLPAGTTLVARCSDPGKYKLRGSSTRTCASGIWTGVTPRCSSVEALVLFQGTARTVSSEGKVVLYPRHGTELKVDCVILKRNYNSDHPPQILASHLNDSMENRVNITNHYSVRNRLTLNPPQIRHSGTFTCQKDGTDDSHSVEVVITELTCPAPEQLDNVILGPTSAPSFPNGSYAVGTNVNFICSPGYRRNGTQTRTCSAMGEWTNIPPTCQATSCSPTLPGDPVNGTVSCSNRENGRTVCTASCSPGYRLTSGSTSRTCYFSWTSGVWTGSAPVCSSLQCSALDVPSNGDVSCSNDRNLDSVCTFSCPEGYRLAGVSTTRTCIQSGTSTSWTGITPSCLLVECHPEYGPPNGWVSCTNGKHVGSSCTFYCNSGYQLTGDTNIRTCIRSGNSADWSGSDLTCTRMQCPDTPDGSVYCSNSRDIGSTCSFSCPHGHRRTGGSTSRTCTVSGNSAEWSGSEITCSPIQCYGLHTPRDASISCTNSWSVGSVCTLSCSPGYRLTGESTTRTCTLRNDGNNADWNGVQPYCSRIQCSVLYEPYGTISCTSLYDVGSECRYSCRSGYRLTGGPATRTCSQSGNSADWTGPEPTCSRGSQIECVVPTTENGIYYYYVESSRTYDTPAAGTPYAIDSAVTLQCQNGYRIHGSNNTYFTLHCTNAGSWSDSLFCEEMTCPAPNVPANGGFTKRSGELRPDGSYPKGAQVEFYCNRGYRISGADISECSSHGNSQVQWSSVVPVCEEILCPTPRVPLKGIIYGLPADGHYPSGFQIWINCTEGFEVDGPSIITCGNDGRWSSTPTCRGINRCIAPLNELGRYRTEGGMGDPWGNGTLNDSRVRVSVSCDNAGHITQDPVMSKCLTGVWSPPWPICVVPKEGCEIPRYNSRNRVYQFVGGSEIDEVTSYPYYTILPHGTTVVARCHDPGKFRVVGNVTRACNDGRWTGVAPRCEEVSTMVLFYGASRQPSSNGTVVVYPVPGTILKVDCAVTRDWWEIPNRARISTTADTESMEGPRSHSRRKQRLKLEPPQSNQSGTYTCRKDGTDQEHSVEVLIREIDCPLRPLVLTNGTVTQVRRGFSGSGYSMGAELRYACDDEFRLDGSFISTCEMGQWTAPEPTCKPSKCPEIELKDIPDNAVMVGVYGSGRNIGDERNFYCKNGFVLTGDTNNLQCLDTGEWSAELPSCEPRGPTEEECQQSADDLCAQAGCESWQKCVITGCGCTDRQNCETVCSCINPHNCGVSGPTVCGTDARYYTSVCHLKATACLLNTGVDVATDDRCVTGLIPADEMSKSTTDAGEAVDDSSSSSSNSWE